MSNHAAPNDIVLFWYKSSPYGRRVAWYLTLRNIAFAECLQPPLLPRPDLDALGVKYRRSPVMAIGRDIYVDTRLIIEKLEERFPASAEHPALSSEKSAGIAGLLQKLAIEGSIFQQVVRLIPPQMLQDERFVKDRAQFTGGKPMGKDKLARPEGIVHLRQIFSLLESLFADGRLWVAGTEQPSLADLEGLWPIDWLIADLRAPKEYFSAEVYPKVFDWRSRFKSALKAAQSRAPRPVSLTGENAVRAVTASGFTDQDLNVDPKDPLELEANTMVEIIPTDDATGLYHQDRGRLLKLTGREVAIAFTARSGDEVHLHAPRWQFRVRQAKADARM